MKRQAPAFILALIMTFVLVCAAQVPAQTKICLNSRSKYFLFELYGSTPGEAYSYMVENKCDLTNIPVSIKYPRVAADKSQELCTSLQNEYLIKYRIMYAKRDPNLYKQTESALRDVKNQNCETASLPLINPIPSFIQPTEHQVKCVGLLKTYFDAWVKYAMSAFGPSYVNLSIPYIDIVLNNCDTERFWFVSPTPDIPRLFLDCTKLTENYMSAYQNTQERFRYAPSNLGPLMPFMPSS